MTTAVQSTKDPGPVVAQLLDRAADPERWERFEQQMRSTGFCRRPVRLRGQVDAVDLGTGECRTVYSTEPEPDRTLLKCCGNRREAVCPSCAETYRGDAYQLVAAGLRGGKGVPESVSGHPIVFVTLTAPSFGPVHSRRVAGDVAQRCRPRRQADVCPHGVRLSCGEVHDEDDPRLGEPLCPECFDYEHAVLWNALAPELWRRTAIQIPRELARLAGLSHRELRRRVRVSYVKVAEYQRRGALHFHCVIRLDRAQPRATAQLVEPPGAGFSWELLDEAVRAAVARVTVPSPAPDDETAGWPSREIRWGLELEVRPLDPGSSAAEAGACAGYIAKYATKSTEVVGGLTSRVGARDLPGLRGARSRAPLRRLRVAAGPRAASARPAAAAVGAHARVPRALLHEEPAVLDDVHGAAPGAPRARAAPPAPGRAAAIRGAARERVARAASSERFAFTGIGYRTPGTRGWRSPRPPGARAAPGRARGASNRAAGAVQVWRESGRSEVEMGRRSAYITAREVGRAARAVGPTRSCATTARAASRGDGCGHDPAGPVPCGARSRRRGTASAQLSIEDRADVSARHEHVEAAERESIRALATVTLDARALDELGPRTIDRLADLVAARLAERRAAGEAPLLTTAEAARVGGRASGHGASRDSVGRARGRGLRG